MPINPYINRFRDLLLAVPEGAYFAQEGIVLPFRDSPYVLRFTTDAVAGALFGVFVNGDFQGVVNADALGNLVISVTLLLGTNEVRLVEQGTQEATVSTITTRNYAVWLASHADQFEILDDYIDEVQLDLSLDTCFTADLEAIWGNYLSQPNDISYDLEAYRDVLRQLYLGYRLFGAKVRGMYTGVSAFTSVDPLDFFRRSHGKRWVLGESFLENPYFNVWPHAVAPTPTIPGIVLERLSPMAPIGAASLNWNPLTNIVTYTDVSGAYTTVLERTKYAKSLAVPLSGVTLGAPNGATPLGDDGLLEFLVGPARLQWTAPGEAGPGPAVAVPISGAYMLAALGGSALVVTVDTTQLPAYDTSIDVTIQETFVDREYEFTGIVAAATIITAQGPFAILPAANVLEIELDQKGIVTVTLPIGPAIVAAAVALAINNALVVDPRYGVPYAAAAVVVGVNYVVLTGASVLPQASIVLHASSAMQVVFGILPTNQPKLIRNAIETRAVITVSDSTLLPLAPAASAFTVYRSITPDSWRVTSTGLSLTQHLTPRFSQSDYRLICTSIGPAIEVWRSVDMRKLDKYLGFEFRISAWLTVFGGACNAYLECSFDDGVTWQTSAAHALVAKASPLLLSDFIMDTYILDPYATSFLVRVRVTGPGGAFSVFLDNVQLDQPEVSARCLKVNTIPRSRHRAEFGHLMWAWCPDVLTTEEQDAIGFATPPLFVEGQIDKLSAAHVQIDRFDVSEIDPVTGEPANLKGICKEADWPFATLTNLTAVPRVPSRLTHVVPTVFGEQEETLVVAGGPPYLATLAYVADMDPDNSMLLRDGVPMLQTMWSWSSSTVVQINAAIWSSTSVYVMRYRALYQILSPAIDLEATWGDYVWYADYHLHTRFDAERLEVDTEVDLFVDYGTFRAVLDRPAVPDTDVSTLYRDDGTELIEIPRYGWEFIDSYTVSLAGEFMKANSLYRLRYKRVAMNNEDAITTTLEVRSAINIPGLAVATWIPIEKGAAVKTDALLRYHQLRLTFAGVEYDGDLRCFSLTMKGLNLFGVGGTIPGLRP